jgi:hypothetical protein
MARFILLREPNIVKKKRQQVLTVGLNDELFAGLIQVQLFQIARIYCGTF